MLSKFSKFNLLSKEKTSIDKNETTIKNGYTKEETPSYVKEKTVYYISYNDKLLQIDKNFEVLKTNLNKKEIIDYLKKNKPSIKNFESLIKLTNFLNSVNLD